MTLIELYTAALQEIGVLAAGEVAEPDDAEKVAEKYRGLFAMLDSKELTSWNLTEDVPEAVDVPLTYMLAFLSAPSFGVSPQRRAELGVMGALDSQPPSFAERMLRKYIARPYYYETIRAEYF